MDSYNFRPLCISCSSESVTQSVLLRGSVHCLHESWASSSYTTHSAWQRLLQTSVTRFSPSPNALWAGGQPPPASFLAWSGVCSLVKKSFTKKNSSKKRLTKQKLKVIRKDIRSNDQVKFVAGLDFTNHRQRLSVCSVTSKYSLSRSTEIFVKIKDWKKSVIFGWLVTSFKDLFEVQFKKDEFTRPFAEKRCPLLHRTLLVLRSMNYSCHTHALSLLRKKNWLNSEKERKIAT